MDIQDSREPVFGLTRNLTSYIFFFQIGYTLTGVAN
jgi:hypothetical protein